MQVMCDIKNHGNSIYGITISPLRSLSTLVNSNHLNLGNSNTDNDIVKPIRFRQK